MLEDGHAVAPKTHAEPPRSRTLQVLATLLPVLARLHVVLYRRTGGAIGQRIFGTRVLLLSTTGRRTGQPRTTPVAYLTAVQARVIIGGAAGAARHPGWWLNLQADPLAQVQIGRQRLRVSAALATREEREQLWARYPAQRALFDSMQRQVSREIPVVVLRRLDTSLSAPTGGQRTRSRRTRSASAETRLAAQAIHRAASAVFSVGARRLNPLTLRLAGSRWLPMLAVIQHRGRRSGRAYATPAGARATGAGFVVPLTFGERTDWYRNVRAAGECVIRWKGVSYPVTTPELVDWATARSACYPVERVLMPLLGIEQFVRLRHAASRASADPLSQT